MTPLNFTFWDIIIVSPAAFAIGVIVGYVIRARFNGKED
jgi:hypothetical protein